MIKIGDSTYRIKKSDVRGDFVTLHGGPYYRISNVDQMRPFFMTLVSHSDHWLFVSSLGGLTAGRKNPENALFPYYTDDKIHDSHEITGSKTVVLVDRDGQKYLWEPFSSKHDGLYRTERNLYKSIYGNQLVFEEVNKDLELTFSYKWASAQSMASLSDPISRIKGIR
jgi:hypothetical protein